MHSLSQTAVLSYLFIPTTMSTAPTAPTVAAATPPPTPKVGGVIDNLAWTGGKPTVDWQDSTKTPSPRSPFCFRPTSPLDAGKHHRGLISKPNNVDVLTQADNTVSSFSMFCTLITEHVLEYGLDTIFYVPHMKGHNVEMVSVLEHHNLFPDVATFSTALQQATAKWDKYDRANDRACCVLLKNCIDKELHKELLLYPDDTSHAAGIIMFLRDRRQHSGAGLWENKRDAFKKLTPESYPGFDIEKYCSDVLRLYQDLNSAHNWQTALTLSFLNQLVQVPVLGFATLFFNIQHSVNLFVDSSAHMSYEEALKAAKRNHYDIPSLCRQATSHYRLLVTNDSWPPAKNAFDKGTIPEGNAAQVDLESMIGKLLDSRLSALTGALNDPNRSTRTPDNATNGQKPSQGNSSWRVTEKPGPNAPHTKLVNGIVYNFCNKCKRGQGFWTSTHTAAEHRGYSGTSPSHANQGSTSSTSRSEANAAEFHDDFRF